MRKLGLSVLLLLCLGVGRATASPIIYIDDAGGLLGTVDIATNTTTIIGDMHVVMSDIAFDPLGNLYGIDFGHLYSINKTTAAATLIGTDLGGLSPNALTFAPDGTLYSASDAGNFYTINTTTGAASFVGTTGFSAAGDLAFHDGSLYLTTTNDGGDLAKINPATGAGSLVGNYGSTNMFGLANASNNILYGLDGNEIFAVNTTDGSRTLVVTYSGGLGQAYGAAFAIESVDQQRIDDPAPVPEPATLLLLGAGLVAVGARRRFKKRV